MATPFYAPAQQQTKTSTKTASAAAAGTPALQRNASCRPPRVTPSSKQLLPRALSAHSYADALPLFPALMPKLDVLRGRQHSGGNDPKAHATATAASLQSLALEFLRVPADGCLPTTCFSSKLMFKGGRGDVLAVADPLRLVPLCG